MSALGDFGLFVAFAVMQLLMSVLQLLLSPIAFALDRSAAGKPKKFTSVLITGGSSGLGAALAEGYAAKGVHIAITGRNEARLREIASKCEAKGATVDCAVVNVTDKQPLLEFIERVDAKHPLDLVVANAGITGMAEDPNELYTVHKSFIDVTNTNVLGVANTIFPAIAKMCARKRGQVVLMGSLSGNYPLQAAPDYSASKSFVLSMGRSLRKYLAIYNVGITVLAPGFVRTPLLTSSKKYPFEVSLQDALPVMKDHIARNVGYVPFPTVPAILVQILGSVHPIFFDFIGPFIITRVHRKITTRLLLSEAEAAKKRT